MYHHVLGKVPEGVLTGSGAAGAGFGAEGAGTVAVFEGPEKTVFSKSYQNFKILENFLKPKIFLESPCPGESKNVGFTP